MQDLLSWLKLNPAAFAAVAGLFGGLVAAAVAVLTSWMSHYFTSRREAAKSLADERRDADKANREAAAARRAVLRAHLERLVECVLKHTSLNAAWAKDQIARVAVGKSESEADRDAEAALLNEATALAILYFPALTQELELLRNATVRMLGYLDDNLPRLAIGMAPSLPEGRLAQSRVLSIALQELRSAEHGLLTSARGLIDHELLPGTVNASALAVR